MAHGWKRMLAGGVLALGLVGAACSNYGGADTTATGDGKTTAPTKTTAATSKPASSGATTGAVTCDTSPGKTAVTLEDFDFVPPKLSAKACTTVNLDNKGGATHTFTIDGSPINVNLPGGTQNSAELALAPGEYIYYCKFHGSPDGSGMAGTLTVT